MDNGEGAGKVSGCADRQDHGHVVGDVGHLWRRLVGEGEVLAGKVGLAVLPGVEAQGEVDDGGGLALGQGFGEGVAGSLGFRAFEFAEVHELAEEEFVLGGVFQALLDDLDPCVQVCGLAFDEGHDPAGADVAHRGGVVFAGGEVPALFQYVKRGRKIFEQDEGLSPGEPMFGQVQFGSLDLFAVEPGGALGPAPGAGAIAPGIEDDGEEESGFGLDGDDLEQTLAGQFPVALADIHLGEQLIGAEESRVEGQGMDEVTFGGFDVLRSGIGSHEQGLGEEKVGGEVPRFFQGGDGGENRGGLFVAAQAGLGQCELEDPFVARLGAEAEEPLGGDAGAFKVFAGKGVVGEAGVTGGDFLVAPVDKAKTEGRPGGDGQEQRDAPPEAPWLAGLEPQFDGAGGLHIRGWTGVRKSGICASSEVAAGWKARARAPESAPEQQGESP